MKAPLEAQQWHLVAALAQAHRDNRMIEEITLMILLHPELQDKVAAHLTKRRPQAPMAPFAPGHRFGLPQRKEIHSHRKTRIVWAPNDLDYVQQLYWLFGVVVPIAENYLSNETHAFRQGKSTSTAIASVIAAVGNAADFSPMIQQEDIVDCFPNLQFRSVNAYWPGSFTIVLEEINSRYNEGLLRFAERAAGLPQGYPLVPMVANVVIDDIMRPIREYYRDKSVAVIVYCDDISIIGPKNRVKEARSEIAEALRVRGMNFHSKKSRTSYPKAGGGSELLGMEITWGTAALPPNIRARKTAYVNLREKVAQADSLAHAKSIIEGWKQAYSICNDPHHISKTHRAIANGMTAFRDQADRNHSPHS